MVVNAQLDFAQKKLEAFRQHAGRCHVHGDDHVPCFHRFLGQTLMEPGEPGRYLGVVQHMSRFSQLPQSQAQCRSGTDGIAVGTAVGQDAKIVMGQQILCCLIPRQYLHRA